VYIIRKDPKELILEADNDLSFIRLVRQACEEDSKGGRFVLKNNLKLQRGPYDIIAVMDESDDTRPLKVIGPLIDLFDADLPVLMKKTVKPGEQAYLYNLNRVENKQNPRVLAAASRTYEEKSVGNSFSFISKSPSGTRNVMRVLLPEKPQNIRVFDSKMNLVKQMNSEWDHSSSTCLIRFENSSEGHRVEINW
jgi:hypothetical protein